MLDFQSDLLVQPNRSPKGLSLLEKLVLLLVAWSFGTAQAQDWTKHTAMPTARSSLATVVLDGKIYALGGNQSSRETNPTLAVEVYDPLSETWTSKAPLLAARRGPSASVVNGRLYAVEEKTLQVYDPVTDSWTRRADPPLAREFITTSTVAGKLFLMGGGQSAVYMYDPISDTWARRANMPTGREGPTEVIGGQIYAIGGEIAGATIHTALRSVEVYDPLTDTWTEKTGMSTGRLALATVVVGGKIYALGGAGHNGTPNHRTTEIYDPVTDTWSAGPRLTSLRQSLQAEFVQGRLYVVGGTQSWSSGGMSTIESLPVDQTEVDPPQPRPALLRGPRQIIALAGGPAMETDIELVLQVPGGASEPRLRLDLSPLGMDESIVLEPQGAGRFTAHLQLPSLLRNGVHWLPVSLTEAASTPELLTFIHLKVFPAGDLVVLDKTPAPSWILDVNRRVVATPVTFAGRDGLALESSGSWLVALATAEPIDPFGYQALRFAFHPGQFTIPDGREPRLWVTTLPGRTVYWTDQVDLNLQAWQEVTIPLEEFGLKPEATLEGMDIRGNLESTFYLGDVLLVAQEPPADPGPTAIVEEHQNATPAAFSLEQNYPNPFNSGTVIRFALPQAQQVDLAIYNIAGQRVVQLANGLHEAGQYSLTWDGRDQSSRSLASGLYLYRLQAGDRIETRRLLLLR